MATGYTKTAAVPYNNHDANVVKWTLAAGESGDPLLLPEAADRSVHIVGTFNGATVVFEGSNDTNDGTSRYKTLTDPLGNPISKTAAALCAVSEMTRLVRPSVTGGDVSTAIEIFLLLKR